MAVHYVITWTDGFTGDWNSIKSKVFNDVIREQNERELRRRNRDEELKERGLYQPGMEFIKQWFQLSALSSNKKILDKMREQIIAEELLSVQFNDSRDIHAKEMHYE